MRFVLPNIIAALLLWSASPALACEPVKGYRKPTNFELVDKAQLIILARVVSGPKAPTSGLDVKIEPIRVLKGTLPGTPLGLAGSVAWNDRTIPSMPTPLATSHFSVGMGACVRLFYPEGGLVLAMFGPPAKTAPTTNMTQLFEPFARVVEDVEGPDAIWVHAVEAYIALQKSANGPALRQAVELRRGALSAQSTNVEAQAIAADLQTWLDATDPAGPKPDTAPRWGYIDMVDDSVAMLGVPGAQQRELLRCKRGGAGFELYAIGREPGEAMALEIAGQSFPAKPASLQIAPTLKSASAEMPLDAKVLAALSSATGPVSISVAGEKLHAAAPADVLQKLAARCSALIGR